MDYQVNKNTIIGDILDKDGDVAPFFLEIGMHCLGCPASRGETIEEACEVFFRKIIIMADNYVRRCYVKDKD